MKKAKIMLGAIALFAVVGGALAFKAKSFGSNIILFSYTSSNTIPAYTATGLAGCFKPVPISNAATTTSGAQFAAAETTILTNQSTVCTTFTKQLNDE